MKSLAFKSLLLAAITCASATAGLAAWPDYKGFWVVGNLTAGTCEIVTSNPVMDNPLTSFSSGPYQSLDDAKLARSGIPQCPKEPVASSK
jgi:hypothetical protein